MHYAKVNSYNCSFIVRYKYIEFSHELYTYRSAPRIDSGKTRFGNRVLIIILFVRMQNVDVVGLGVCLSTRRGRNTY